MDDDLVSREPAIPILEWDMIGIADNFPPVPGLDHFTIGLVIAVIVDNLCPWFVIGTIVVSPVSSPTIGLEIQSWEQERKESD